MRKVFISAIKIKKEATVPAFRSRDFDLGDKKFFAPVSYLLDANLEDGDDVLVLTGITDNADPRENYEKKLKPELERILEAHHAKYELREVTEPDPEKDRELMDSLTFSRFFKEVRHEVLHARDVHRDGVCSESGRGRRRGAHDLFGILPRQWRGGAGIRHHRHHEPVLHQHDDQQRGTGTEKEHGQLLEAHDRLMRKEVGKLCPDGTI